MNRTVTLLSPLTRASALLAGLALFSLVTTRIQGADAAQADIGGGFALLGLVMVVPAVWAARDARTRPPARCVVIWSVAGAAFAIGVDAVIVLRQGMQPWFDLVFLGAFLGAAVAVPAILAALVMPRPAEALR